MIYLKKASRIVYKRESQNLWNHQLDSVRVYQKTFNCWLWKFINDIFNNLTLLTDTINDIFRKI